MYKKNLALSGYNVLLNNGLKNYGIKNNFRFSIT